MSYNIIPQRLSSRFDDLVQQAVDEAIEQHRIKGQAIAVSDNNGNVQTIQPEDILPLAQRLQPRK